MNIQIFGSKTVAGIKPVFLHLIAWVLFIFYELLTLYFGTGTIVYLWQQLIFYGVNISLFYVNANMVLDYSFKRSANPYLAWPVLTALLLAAYLVIKYAIDFFLVNFRIPLTNTGRLEHYTIINLWRGVYFLGFSTLYWSIKRLFAYKDEIAEAEKRQLIMQMEKTEIEKNLAEIRNAYLQQQINPHFLFNTLNFVYNTVYKYSEQAAEVILKLSDILRFSLEDHDASGLIPLSREIEQIKQVIEINRVRYDFDLYLTFETEGDLSGVSIIPLALLTFVENVFKHGNLKNILQPARIKISFNEEHVLKFVTWNLKKAETARKRIKSIGIQNTIKRLQYTYRDKYCLTINDLPESYGMELTVEL